MESRTLACRIGAGLSTSESAQEGAREAAREARGDALGREEVDLAFVFHSPAHLLEAEAAAEVVREEFAPRHLLGCVAEGVVGRVRELEEGTAVAVWAGALPGAEIEGFHAAAVRHPDVNEARAKGLPPHLGLIESTDAGESWENVSLLGEADFHVLRFAGERVYGYDSSNDRLLVSADEGRGWEELGKPGPLVDLAVDPSQARRIVATSAGGLEEGLFESDDGGESWTRVSDAIGLLAWPARERLYLVAGGGQVFASRDGRRGLEHRGQIGGQPAALLAQTATELYVALDDGTIKRSADAGATWTVRSTP